MPERRNSRRLLALLAFVGLGLLAVTPAAAQPPPPSFVKFTIYNGVGCPAKNVKIELYLSINDHHDIATDPAVVLEVDEVAPCQTVTLALPITYGVARIHCTAECPPGKRLGDTNMEAHWYDWVPTKLGNEYAGFTDTKGNGSPAPLDLRFLPPQSGTGVWHLLRGWARWDKDYGLPHKGEDTVQ